MEKSNNITQRIVYTESLSVLEFRIAQELKNVLNDITINGNTVEIPIFYTTLIDQSIELANHLYHLKELDKISIQIGLEVDNKLKFDDDLYNHIQSINDLDKVYHNLLKVLYNDDKDKFNEFIQKIYAIYIDFIFKQSYIENYDDEFWFLYLNKNILDIDFIVEKSDNEQVIGYWVFERHLPLISSAVKTILNFENNNWYNEIIDIITQLNKFKNADVITHYIKNTQTENNNDFLQITHLLFGSLNFDNYKDTKTIIAKYELYLGSNIRYLLNSVDQNKTTHNEFVLLKILLKRIFKGLKSYSSKGRKYYIFLGYERISIVKLLKPFLKLKLDDLDDNHLADLCNKIIVSDNLQDVLK